MPKGSDTCIATHAEQNSLLTCKDVDKIWTCYCTHEPCLRCAKQLLNTGCSRVVYHYAGSEPAAKELWVSAGGTWEQKGE